jgi:hypothetical protein
MKIDLYDCQNKGYEAIVGIRLKGLYKVVNFLNSGGQGHIFELENGLIAKFG